MAGLMFSCRIPPDQDIRPSLRAMQDQEPSGPCLLMSHWHLSTSHRLGALAAMCELRTGLAHVIYVLLPLKTSRKVLSCL